MPVADTSKETYHKIKPSLSRRRRQVYNVIAGWPIGKPDPTIADIAKKLSWQCNEVSGRVTELKDSGAILITGRKFNPSGKRARTYATPKTAEQLSLL